MDPIGTTTGIIAAAAHFTTLVKSALTTAQSQGYSQMLGELLDVQVAALNLVEKQQHLLARNEQLEAKCKELESALKTHGSLFLAHNFYWEEMDDGTIAGPYSRVVWESESKLASVRCLGHPTRANLHGTMVFYEKVEFFDDCPNGTGASSKVPTDFLRERKWNRLAELPAAK